MAKVINKGLAKADSKMIRESVLIGPVMVFPKSKKERSEHEEKKQSNS